MFFHIYYNVPNCPNCGSPYTGRYVKAPLFYNGLAYEESLKNGEIVTEVDTVPYKNCYCESCGFEWHKYIGFSIISTKQLMEEKKRRGAAERFREYVEANYINGKRPKDPLYKRLFL